MDAKITKQLDKIFLGQKEFFETQKMQTIKNRILALKKLYKNLDLFKDKIYSAIKEDLNKSSAETYMAEIGLIKSEISYMLKHIKSLSRPERVHSPLANFPASSFIQPCPYGSVLIISPWNYPYLLSLEPLVDAISAGNSVVIKPSELSPNTSEVIKEIVETAFERGHVDVVLGGVEECTYLLDKDFDYIFYTGSTRVGEIVMKKAAEHFTPVTLEMGGKSPCIVDETANIPLTAKRIVFGKLLNCGQTCVAPDYLYCHKSVKDELVKEISKQIVRQYSIDPIHNKDYPKMINQKQFDAMRNLIKDNVLFGGKVDEKALKIEPTIVSAKFTDEVMKEEIFGPILPVLTYENLDEAIANVKKLNPPLALYIFSKSKANQNKVLNKINFGGGCVNDTIMHIASSHLPFGGIKQSGIGAYHGKTGFDTFSHKKAIVKKSSLDLPFRYQPTSKFKQFFVKLFLR